jgi:hypothetical protein
MGVLMQESITAKLRDEEAMAEGGGGGAMVLHNKSSKKKDAKHGEVVSAPPHPISELVRSGRNSQNSARH